MPGAAVQRSHTRKLAGRYPVRLGFVPLIDAAPLIVASKLGYFADEMLDVRLHKQIGWGNIRDRLTYGELDATHGPIGMAPASLVPLECYDQPLGIVMGLSSGGNAITIARELAAMDVSANAPAAWRQRLGRPIRLAYVASVGTHHFALRDMLKSAGLILGRDAELCIIPPAQMPTLLERRVIDGFCAGEPWNTLAELGGSGVIYRATTQWTAVHPEKALLVSRRWQTKHADTAVSLIRALLRGCEFCETSANQAKLAELLAPPEFLAIDEAVISRSLTIDRWLQPGVARPPFRSFARAATAPAVEAVEWIVTQMTRWGVISTDVNIPQLARDSVLPEAYARATQGHASSPPHPSAAAVNTGTTAVA